jgi:formyltetrahydrofolate-dependent phosphoribosylglycinamide formyltransferase
VTPARIGVFASGGGSNLAALLAHLECVGGATVVGVWSNRADAGALGKARDKGIATTVLDDPADGEGILRGLAQLDVGTVALAGYLKRVPSVVTKAFAGRLMNVHPSLLPAFGGHGMYGRRVHEAVLAAGAAVTGATVHLVDEVYDRGPIIAQWPVPVAPDDTADALGARVLRVEHVLFSRAVHAMATGRIVLGTSGRPAAGVPLADATSFVLGDTSDLPSAIGARFP